MSRSHTLSLWERIWLPFEAHFREPQLSLLTFEDEEQPESPRQRALAERREKVENLRQENARILKRVSDISHLLEDPPNERQ